jgi:hypothetical protein
MDRQAVAKLTEFIVGSVENAHAHEKPFYHLQFTKVFPDDIYSEMIREMPVAADYRALPGRDNVNILDDGTATRVKIDLFPEYIRRLPKQKRELWDLVGRALCSNEVRDAFVRRLAPALERRFGPDYREVGMFPIPILTRDVPKYKITPHTDTKWKGVTVQFYLPPDDTTNERHRHDLPRQASRRQHAEGQEDAVLAEHRLRLCGRQRFLALGRSGRAPCEDA